MTSRLYGGPCKEAFGLPVPEPAFLPLHGPPLYP